MTDGIIQEVIKKYQLEFMNMREQARLINALSLVEKELIEKIKQDFPITEPFLHVYGVNRVRRMLIGDNQE